MLVRQRNWRTLTFTNTNYYHVQNETAAKGGGGANFNVHQYKYYRRLMKIMIKKLSISHIKYFICLFLSAFVVIVLSACGSDFDGYVDEDVDYNNNTFTVEETNGHKIGVSMPTKDLQRWVQDGENMKSQLHNFGYTVDLLYANNDKNLQNEQIKSMIDSGCEVLVIGAIDGSAIAESLETAKKAGVVVIAYDRLIMGSDAINYYATFDNQLVGTLQGQYIVDALDLKNTQGPYHIELFTGSSDDNNCNFFFGGALEVLQPYINTGKLIVTSGQTTKEQCYTQGWSTDIARERMENILKTYYADGTKLDAVLSSNDSVALGIAEALSAQYNGDFPLLTGQDCDINAVKNIINGKQSMSIFKDTRNLAAKVVEMIDAIISDETVPINDTTTYNNGTGIIPTLLCDPVFADKNNYKEILVDSGYYTEDQFK